MYKLRLSELDVTNLHQNIILNVIIYFTENIALHKTAWQKDTVFGNTAGRAVDGLKSSLSIWGSDCVTSWYNRTAEWRVDLGTVVSIHHIFIQYATNNLPWGIVYIFKIVVFKKSRNSLYFEHRYILF